MAVSCTNLVELVRSQAQALPGKRAYTYLLDGEDSEAVVTFADLETRARAIGALLQESVRPGERVVLLYAPGLDYVAAFFGCLFAGCIAVPAYPPEPARLHRTLPRLAAIVKDAQAAAVLTSGDLHMMAAAIFDLAPDLRTPKWIATDDTLANAATVASAWRDPQATGQSVAFLQYTSGSTGDPKGVVLTHANLLANSAQMERPFGMSDSAVMVSWLPLYHDMGLIGGMLQPLRFGGSAVLMSPLDFLQVPHRWLRAISKHRGTIGGGPNFAFDLCVRKTTPEQRAALDLSSWVVAFNGAEPIRAETLTRFAEAFAPSKFEASSFCPCYGLAEGTLMVSAGRGSPAATFDPDALQEGRVVSASQGRLMAASGRPGDGIDVRIVDPDTMAEVPGGRVGEIWVAGPQVAQGYWGKPELSAATFGAKRAEGGGPYLRTGDLGFLHEGYVYVAGRAKDLIIIRGRNLYPNDIEETVESACTAVRKGCAVAFSVDIEGEERIVVVAEAQPPFVADDESELARKAIAEQHGVNVHAVVFIRARSLLKTSSGKVQRRATRQAFLTGALEEVGRTEYHVQASEDDSAQTELTVAELAALSEEQRVEELVGHIRRRLSSALGVPMDRIDASSVFAALGLDSLMAVEMAEHMEMALEVSVPQALLFRDDTTIELLAKYVSKSIAARSGGGEVALERAPLVRADRTGPLPLSYQQLGLWEWEKKHPQTGAWNVPIALRIKGPLRADLFQRAFEHLLAQHEVLRTRIVLVGDEPRATFVSPSDVRFETVDLRGKSTPVEALVAERAYAPTPLVGAPLTTGVLYQVSEAEHVFAIYTHHILFDNATVPVLLGTLRKAYEAVARGEATPPVVETIQYADFAAWQRGLGERKAWDADLAYWAKQLEGASPLTLPYDRPAEAGSRRAHKYMGFLPVTARTAIENLARQESVTVYAVVASILSAVLKRHGAGDDMVLGIVKSTRDQSPKLAHMAGYFTNPLPLRIDAKGTPSLRELVQRSRDATRGLYAHQEPPASVVLGAPTPMDCSRLPVILNVLGAIAFGATAWQDVSVEPMQLPTPQLVRSGDLTIVMVDVPAGTPFEIVGLAERFEEKTINAIGSDFERALVRAAQAPDTSIAALCEG